MCCQSVGKGTSWFPQISITQAGPGRDVITSRRGQYRDVSGQSLRFRMHPSRLASAPTRFGQRRRSKPSVLKELKDSQCDAGTSRVGSNTRFDVVGPTASAKKCRAGLRLCFLSPDFLSFSSSSTARPFFLSCFGRRHCRVEWWGGGSCPSQLGAVFHAFAWQVFGEKSDL